MAGSPAEPLFIVGLPRSGTSWLAAALGQLPGVTAFHEGLGGCEDDGEYFQKLWKHEKVVDCDPALLLYPHILHQIVVAPRCKIITIHREHRYAAESMKQAMHEAGGTYSGSDIVKVIDEMSVMADRLADLEQHAKFTLEFVSLFEPDSLLQVAGELGFEVHTPELEQWAEWWPNYRVTQDMQRVAESEDLVYPAYECD